MSKMILIEEAKLTLVLEALEGIHTGNMTPMAEEAWNKAITALREALAEQLAQPHGWKLVPLEPTQEMIDAVPTKPHPTRPNGWGDRNVAIYKAMIVAAPQPAQQQETVACKTLCELCVKRGYHFCANAAQTTPIPSPPASKPWVGLTDEEILEAWCIHLDEGDEDEIEEWRHVINEAREIEAKLKEKNA